MTEGEFVATRWMAAVLAATGAAMLAGPAIGAPTTTVERTIVDREADDPSSNDYNLLDYGPGEDYTVFGATRTSAAPRWLPAELPPAPVQLLTILDHDGPANPGGSKSDEGGQGTAGDSIGRLASIAREIAYNDYQGDRNARGGPEDRNVIVETDKPWPYR